MSLCTDQWCLWSLSHCSIQCSLWSLSLCYLPPLCSGNEHPRSSYSLTSKRQSRQSRLPFQHSVVPKILQSMSTAIKPQPSLHPVCRFLSPNDRKIFAVTALSSLHLCRPVNIYIKRYIMYRYKQYGAMLLICYGSCPKCPTVKMLISYLQTHV